MKQMEIWAHRGASGYEPENTLEAFALAIEQKADGIELDVQLSRDGEIMVLHDEIVDRVTNFHGFMKDYTLKQLKEMTVTSGKETGKVYRIPTLAEVLDLMRHTDMKVNIELKNSIFFYEGMEEKVMALVKNMGMEEKVIYSSFNHYSLRKIRKINPEAKTGILMSDGWIDVASYGKTVGADAVITNYPDKARTYMMA